MLNLFELGVIGVAIISKPKKPKNFKKNFRFLPALAGR